jgi:hypothetical protein
MKKNYVKEGWQGSLEVGSLGRLDSQDSIDTLNRGLSDLTPGQYINPFTAINKIRNYLAIAGLSFDNIIDLPFNDRGVQTSTGRNGKVSVPDGSVFQSKTISIPLRQYNGPKGMQKDGAWHEDDGIKDKFPSGLSLELTYSKFKGYWTIYTQVVPQTEEPGQKVLGERGLKEDKRTYDDVHRDLISKGYKPLGGGIYKDPKSNDKVRIHGVTRDVYRIKEELDPVRDAVSRRGIVGKLKGIGRDIAKKYRENQAAGKAAAKKVRQNMGVERFAEGKEKLPDKCSKSVKEENLSEKPKLLLGGKKGTTMVGKLDKVNLVKSMSREKIGSVPGTKLIPDKRFKKAKYKEQLDKD